MRLWLKKLAYIALGYACIVGGLTLQQRDLIYLPQATAPVLAASNLAGFSEKTITTADGLARTVWYAPAAAAQPTVLVYHGNAGNLAQRANLARFLHAAGYGVLLTSYRGYPPNAGRPSQQTLFADAELDARWLQQQGVTPAQMVILGSSLGSGPATFLAAQLAGQGTPVRALILEVPFNSLANAAQHHYWYVPVAPLLWDKFDNAARIASINAPLLIMAAANDEVVPNHLARALYEKAKLPKQFVLVPNTGHNEVLDSNLENFKTATSFLASLP